MPRVVPLRFALLLACLLALTLVQPLTQSAEGATIASPKTRTFQAGIDPYGAYVGQSTCNGTAKPGVLYVKDLLNATYGPRTVGIVRSCSAGGTSEHKEGRALDWMISAKVSSQKAKADAFIKWLLATDQFGNTHAMARRMGVMYIIWNNRMWRAYDAGRGWTDYKGCASSPSSGGDTTCHRDHVHVSFTWDGAYARTSMYTGRVPFQVSAGVSDSSPAVGDTINITGSVSPVAGSKNTKIAIKRMVGSTAEHLGDATIDSSGRYSFPYTVPAGDTYRFKTYKASEGCTSDGCAYGSASSNEVGFTVNTVIKARYAVSITATPDLVPTGTPVLISGKVTPTNVSAGKRISLRSWDASAKVYDYVQGITVAADGTYEATVTPPTGTTKYLVYIPSSECSGSGCAYVGATSSEAVVEARGTVPYAVSAKGSLTTAPVGGTVRITGNVAPTYAAAGTRVSLRKGVGDALEYAGSATVTSKGTFDVPVAADEIGEHRYRIYKPSDGCDTSGCSFGSALSNAVDVDVVPVKPFSVVAVKSSTVLLGQPMRVASGFSPAAVAAGNRVVMQEFRNGTWQTAAVRRLDAQGRIELFKTYTSPGDYRYRFVTGADSCQSGVCALSGGTSPTIEVKAVKSGQQRLNVGATLSNAKPAWGTTITISGRVSPADVVAGTNVSLRRQKDGVLTYVSSARVDAEGRYSLSLRVRGAGTQVYRVYHGSEGCGSYGCLYGADVSNRLYLTVT